MMRKVLIGFAAVASALAVATPASAQYYPAAPPPGYGYGNGYNNNYRVHPNHIRELQVRINRVQSQINRLDRRDHLSEREARRVRDDSRDLEKRLYRASRYGLTQREYATIDNRIRQLEGRVWREANDGNGRRGWGYNAHNNWVDRDRDGRDDRWEDDRGRDHD